LFPVTGPNTGFSPNATDFFRLPIWTGNIICFFISEVFRLPLRQSLPRILLRILRELSGYRHGNAVTDFRFGQPRGVLFFLLPNLTENTDTKFSGRQSDFPATSPTEPATDFTPNTPGILRLPA